MALITHAQIAQMAGVSRSTVSRALQNHPRIPAETRRRIQQLVVKVGYRPNPLVSALMASRSRRNPSVSTIPLAALTAWRPSRELAPVPSLQRLMRGASDRAAELGYLMEEFWIDEPGMTGERINQILINRGISAVMLAPLPSTHSEMQLAWEHFSIGTFAPSVQFPLFHRASHFHFNGTCLLLEEVYRRGYRRPGMILNPEGVQHVREQYLGGMAAVNFRGVFEKKIPPIALTDGQLDLLDKWLTRHEPDILVGDDLRIPTWLKELGYNIPQDIAFAIQDRPSGDEFGGIDQLKEMIGRSVIDLIVAQAHRNERGIPAYAKDTKLPGVWVDGRSVPSRI